MNELVMRRASLVLAFVALAFSTGCGVRYTADATVEPSVLVLGDGAATLKGIAGPAEQAPSVEWTVTSRPEGSSASIAEPASASTSFTPDAIGEYELTFTVREADIRTGGGLASTVGGARSATKTVTLTVTGRPAGRIAFRTQPTDIEAGAIFAPPVQVELRNDRDEPVAGAVEVFLSLSGETDATLTGSTSATTVDGVATFSDLSVAVAGTGYTLEAATAGLAGAISEPFDVTAGAPSAASSTLVVTPASVVADGLATANLRLEVKDAHSNPLPGVDTTLTLDGTDNVFLSAASGVTDADGVFSVEVSSTKAEVKNARALFADAILNAEATFVAGAPSHDHSTLTCAPQTAIANGLEEIACSVSIVDAFGNPIDAAQVALSVTGELNTLTPASPVSTTATGEATVVLISQRAGAKTVTATVGDWSLDAPVTFAPGPVVLESSSLVVSPSSAAADGSSVVLVTVSAADAFGNPVGGADVSLSVSGAGNVLTPGGSQASNALGVATFQLASSVAGLKQLEAVVDGVTLEGRATFTAGAVDTDASSLVAAPPTVAADGVEQALLTATLTDALGNPLEGVAVTFTSTGANNTLVTTRGTTNAAGEATATLKSTTAELKVVTASFAGGELTTHVSFLSDPPVASTSTFVAAPSSVTANGTATSTLTATLKDAQGNPVPGAVVGFSSSSEVDVFSDVQATSNASGVATVQVSSTEAGAKTMTALFGSGQQRTATVTFTAGAPAQATSTLAASPTSGIVANGTDTSSLTATIKDAFGNLLEGVTVAFTSSGGANDTIVVTRAVTDATGTATATIASTRSGAKTVTATFGSGLTRTGSVTFVPGAVSAADSTFVAAPASVRADGVQSSTLTATLRDANGNPVSGTTVNFEVTEGTLANLSAASATSTAAGEASVTLVSTKAEVKTVTATFGASSKTAQVTFTAGAPVAARSTLIASPSSVVADNASTSTLTATLRDAHNNPVPSASVTLTASGSGHTFGDATLTTNASGTATSTLRSSAVGAKMVTATFGSAQTTTATVTFTSGPVVAGTSTFVASPSSVVANGTATTTLTATLRDASNHPVAGEPVTFSSTGTLNTFSASSATTNASGVASVTLKSTRAETKTLTASFDGGSLTDSVAFTAGAPVAARSTFVATPEVVTADNASTSSLVARLHDAFGNPASGAAVTLSATGSGHTFSDSTLTTNGSGVAAATVRSSEVADKTISAAFGDGEVLVATVKFVVGPPVSSTSTFVASPASVVANNSSTSTLTVTLRDAGGHPVAGESVTLSASGTGHTFSNATPSTNASGVATATIRSSAAGTKTITASFGAGQSRTANVTFTPAPPEIIDLTLPASMNSCAVITYRVKQAQSMPVDVAMGFSLTAAGELTPATRHSTQGEGVAALSSSPTGVLHTFVWNTTADLPAQDVTVARFVATPSVGALGGTPAVASGSLTNGFASSVLHESAPHGVNAVAFGDFNRDGRPDAVTASNTAELTGSIAHVHLNDGAGELGEAADVGAAIDSPQGFDIVVADFNRDGWDDFAVPVYAQSRVYVATNDRSGGFALRDYPTGDHPVALTVADFNRDGIPDLATAHPKQAVSLLMATAAGAFGPYVQLAVPLGGNTLQGIASADVNHDGFEDLVVTDATTMAVQVIRGDPGGAFYPPVAYSVGYAGIADLVLRDFNGDGWVDIAVTNEGAHNVALLANDRTGGFPAGDPPTFAVSSPLGIDAGDLDQDGLLDLAVVDSTGSRIQVLLGAADGFGAAKVIGTAGNTARGVAMADLEVDGRLDIVTANTTLTAKALSIARNRTPYFCEPLFEESNAYAAPVPQVHFAQGDMDHDGHLDLVTAGDDGFSVLYGRGDGRFEPAAPVPVELDGAAYVAAAVAVADVDRDGWLDVLLTAAKSETHPRTLVALLNDHARGFTSSIVSDVDVEEAFQSRSLAVGDVNRDGIPDVLVGETNGALKGKVVVMRGAGDGSFGAVRTNSTTALPVLACVDWSRDGFVDYAAAGSEASFHVEVPALPKFDLSQVSEPLVFNDVATADFNRDGWPDFVTSSATHEFPDWLFLGTSSGSFDEERFGVGFGAPTAVATWDVNRDGVPDVLQPTSESMLVLHALDASGTRPATTRSFPVDARSPGDLLVGDYNVDGKADVAMVDFDSGSIVVVLGR